jgi:hypothetical protein
MARSTWIVATLCTVLAGSFARACTPGHVGDPCIPEEEYSATFSGFGLTFVANQLAKSARRCAFTFT